MKAYRHLGYHIGNRMCRLLQRWTSNQICTEQENLNRKLPNDLKLPQTALGGIDYSDAVGRQPLFAEMKRRLIRGYLQTCYEEYFLDTDDVYGESVWRNRAGQSTAYPTLRDAIQALSKRLPSLELLHSDEAEYWRQISLATNFWISAYFENLDITMAYMDAIDADINELNLNDAQDGSLERYVGEDESEIQRDGSSRNMSEGSIQLRQMLCEICPGGNFRYDDVLACHYAVLAIAAQQLHIGRSQHTFQIGGREKLIELMVHLKSEQASDSTPEEESQRIVHELSEMSTCVFQSTDKTAVVSFVQCYCLEWAAEFRERLSDEPIVESKGRFDIALDFRRILLDALESGYRSHIEEVVKQYLDYLVHGPKKAAFTPRSRIALTRSIGNQIEGTDFH